MCFQYRIFQRICFLEFTICWCKFKTIDYSRYHNFSSSFLYFDALPK